MKDRINRKNLQILATYLAYGNGASKGITFDMSRFTAVDIPVGCFEVGVGDTVCKTAGCAVGFAPFAGIKKRASESFRDYGSRTLISDVESDEWDWCFGGAWFTSDNTREGAAKRIQYFLDNGVPDDFEGCIERYDGFQDYYANTEVKK